MIPGERIVNRAHSFLGLHENPPGSNRGFFVEQCQRATFLSGSGWPWCAAFVCKVAQDCGVPLAYNGAGAHDLANHHPPVHLIDAKPGDVVDFLIGSGHTGILLSHGPPGFVTTIDGNWGDRVTQVQHPVNLVRKVWRIPGVDGTPHPKRRRKPLWVVATSASGHRKVVLRAPHRRGVIRWLKHHSALRHAFTISRRKRHGK
jgi:hypothetical protein